MVRKKGFTLIEILVAAFIIIMIASFVVVSVSSARAQSRDSKRIADLDAIRTAVESYKNATGVYPATYPATDYCWIKSDDEKTGCAPIRSWTGLADALKNYISPLPQDPLNGKLASSNQIRNFYSDIAQGAAPVPPGAPITSYSYGYRATISEYKIITKLEKSSNFEDGGAYDDVYEVYTIGARYW